MFGHAEAVVGENEEERHDHPPFTLKSLLSMLINSVAWVSVPPIPVPHPERKRLYNCLPNG